MLILGDFDFGANDNHMKFFCKNYGLKILMKQSTCYKNPSNEREENREEDSKTFLA